jgi:hypothetical protein
MRHHFCFSGFVASRDSAFITCNGSLKIRPPEITLDEWVGDGRVLFAQRNGSLKIRPPKFLFSACVRDMRHTRSQSQKRRLALHAKPSPGDGGRIFNEPALRSFMRSRAAMMASTPSCHIPSTAGATHLLMVAQR